ncbi:MAG: flagellar assembly protein FliW [Pirellulales bacterium]|nr:flagellar assembly protein FliW [Pirellulales bacterium]
MEIATTRFGSIPIEVEDILTFPAGLVGLEECRHWVLLADAQNDVLGWLQSTQRPEVALAVVSPRRFVPHYQLRVMRSELSGLELLDVQSAQVLVIVGKNERAITLNLRAPLVINLSRRLGRQVITSTEEPLQHELQQLPTTWKKSA